MGYEPLNSAGSVCPGAGCERRRRTAGVRKSRAQPVLSVSLPTRTLLVPSNRGIWSQIRGTWRIIEGRWRV